VWWPHDRDRSTTPHPHATEVADTLADMDQSRREQSHSDRPASEFSAMPGYAASTYGDRFADVYDEWYHDVSDVEATVAAITELCPGGRVLELGVGTGRLAIPLAQAGLVVDGIDASDAMLSRLAANDPDGQVRPHLGDMVTSSPQGPYEVILIAYNTIFNLPSPEQQRTLCTEMAARLSPTGRFIVEAFIPDSFSAPGTDFGRRRNGEIRVRSMTVDQVVLSVTSHDPVTGRAEGQFIEITEAGGVRLRPWSIRSLSVAELDQMTQAAGLVLEHRWEDFNRREFTEESDRHVSIYRLS
jgi:SAM-dependent methyltransferase